MAGDKVMRRVPIVMFAPTLGEHVFLLRFQHREFADFGEVAREAGFSVKNRQSSCTGHFSALQWFRSPIAADPADGRLVKAGRAAMFRVGYSTQVQHTPNAGSFGSKTAVTFPCGCHKLLAWRDFLDASASFCRSQGIAQEKQILRQRRLPAENFSGSGMLDGKQISVQRLPSQGGQRGLSP